jgi:hypothetical protein
VFQTIRVSRGEVLGIGKFKVSQGQNFDYVIPALSFIVIRENDHSFVSTCIHLRIDGYGKTQEQATADMIDSALFFLHENFTDPQCKEKGWQNLADLFRADEWSDELWGAYHAVQIGLSMQGIATDSVTSVYKQLGLVVSGVNRLESIESKQLKNELATMWKKTKMFYSSIAEAAA